MSYLKISSFRILSVLTTETHRLFGCVWIAALCIRSGLLVSIGIVSGSSETSDWVLHLKNEISHGEKCQQCLHLLCWPQGKPCFTILLLFWHLRRDCHCSSKHMICLKCKLYAFFLFLNKGSFEKGHTLCVLLFCCVGGFIQWDLRR